MQILPSGHLIAKATIHGKEGSFIFDTGGGINLFFNSFAKDLQQKSSYNFLTAHRATGEKVEVPLFESEEISFAGKKFNKIPYATFDMKLTGIHPLKSQSLRPIMKEPRQVCTTIKPPVQPRLLYQIKTILLVRYIC
ncbi:MAG: hypothetical protein EOO95_06650 [Pedobacter sp.]|nr:MAG: hypothetical protein EOO95_06650 [Pedobacter sp.]